MASAAPQSQPALLDTRPYFCHQCSHQWMKLAAAIFQCPRCHEGFIEEVTGDFQPRPASPELSAGVFSLLTNISRLTNSLVSPSPPSRGGSRNQASGSRGSRASARNNSSVNHSTLSIVVGTTNRAGANDGSPNNNENGINRDIRIRFGVGRGAGFFSFPIDDVMTTLFSAAPRQPAMTDNQLEEIPKALITAEDIAAQIQCAICFDDYAQDEGDVRKLPCNHLFHEKCIFPWLKSNATCPVCRARMPNANAENEDDNSDMDEDMFEEISRIIDFPIIERAQQQGAVRNRRRQNRARIPVIETSSSPEPPPLSPQNNNNNNDDGIFSNGVQTRSRRLATAPAVQVAHSSRALFRPSPGQQQQQAAAAASLRTARTHALLASYYRSTEREASNEAREPHRVAYENRLRRVPASTSLAISRNNNIEPSTSSRGAEESVARSLNTARMQSLTRARPVVRGNAERSAAINSPSTSQQSSGAIATRTRSHHNIAQPPTSTDAANSSTETTSARPTNLRRTRGRGIARGGRGRSRLTRIVELYSSSDDDEVNYEPPRHRARIVDSESD